MKRMRFPGAFCVGSDLLREFPSYVSCYGKNVVFIGGERALGAVRGRLEQSFAGSGCTCGFVRCDRTVSEGELARVSALPEVQAADVLCATGGGSSMDITRTTANRLRKPLVMFPTTAASDAPCSFVSVFYSEDGSEVVGDEAYPRCPDLVLVDSSVVAAAPPRQLASGMGDALATWYEGSTCRRGPGGTGITGTAVAMAELCREIVLRDGVAAFRAVQGQFVTPQLENVIEANCFLSGVGGLNTGCAAAHGIGDYLCRLPGGHGFMHGERVFVGLIVQLILEQYPEEEFRRLVAFGRQVGLPVCLTDLGVEREQLRDTAAELARGLQGDHFMVNLCCDYSEMVLTGAFLYACRLGNTDE